MILIIDDDAGIRSSLGFLLKHAGFETKAAALPEEALEVVRREKPQLILMDMNFNIGVSGEEGLHLLKQVKIFRPETPVILITAWGSISLAVEGMRAGAFDFVTKPWDNRTLLNSIRTALELSRPKEAQRHPLRFDRIIGCSRALTGALELTARIAPTDASVLITGESGAGKELIAEAIHANSRRAKAPFVKVNLGGMVQSLFESEMFGHRRGAFTDALTDRAGRFETADGGTIFLDEIGDLDLSCQVKLLRVLQDRTFEALGDSRPRKVDVRVVSATNCNLHDKIAERTFREDLFYRINLITIHLPPLRERPEDIPLLARHFAAQLAEANRLPAPEFTPAALAYLQSLTYPGNIRELKNLVERTLLVCGKTTVDEADLSASQPPSPVARAGAGGLRLDEVERQSIVQALDACEGNLSRVASTLGISRAALYRRLDKYGIRP